MKLCFPLALCGFLLSISLSAQETALSTYAVQLKDKQHSSFSKDRPTDFLSPQAITRKLRFGIAIDERDLPVSQHYLQQIETQCHCKVSYSSKWFNTAIIRGISDNTARSLSHLSFVKEVNRLGAFSIQNEEKRNLDVELSELSETGYTDEMYGKGLRQIEMLNGQLLHELGYEGQGINIAVIDAGFFATDHLPVFQQLREENRIITTRNFAFENTEDVYNWSTHGTSVLSIMAANLQDSLIGTAPKANYYLFVSENVTIESQEEEYNWAAAVEVCDSLGIDIINSSLGYSTFDDETTNYTYADMDGNTTIITRAADIAASKGILVVNSAGNEGDDSWHYLTAPSDADSVLCIGAVDSLGMHAFFSGFGPSSDGRIKPNVSAMGQMTAYASTDSLIRRGNGTSFSSPVIAGMAACLWQAFPEKNNMEIFSTIEQSAHIFLNPNDELGYGIPNFWNAFTLLKLEEETIESKRVHVFPNPCSDYIQVTFEINTPRNITISIFDIQGRLMYSDKILSNSIANDSLDLNDEIKQLQNGTYLLITEDEKQKDIVRFVKMRP